MILWSSAWHLIFLLQILQFATNSFDGNLYHFQFQLLIAAVSNSEDLHVPCISIKTCHFFCSVSVKYEQISVKKWQVYPGINM